MVIELADGDELWVGADRDEACSVLITEGAGGVQGPRRTRESGLGDDDGVALTGTSASTSGHRWSARMRHTFTIFSTRKRQLQLGIWRQILAPVR